MPPKPPPRVVRNPPLPPKPKLPPTAPRISTPQPKPHSPIAPKLSSKPTLTTPSSHGTVPRSPKPPPRYLPPLARTIGRTASIVFFTGATLLFIRDKVISMDTVRGSSMAPSLSPGADERGENDWVLIKRWMPSLKVERGDVVTFWKPHRPDEISIKRVVGVAGDTIYPARGYALQEWDDNRVGLNDGLPVPGDGEERERGKVVVPHNHVWVEGDNWRKSYDSNDFGPITMALIDGKATKVWRKGWFRDITDERKEKRSRVVEHQSDSKVPQVFVE